MELRVEAEFLAYDRAMGVLLRVSTAQPSAAPAEDAGATAEASSAYFAKLKIGPSKEDPQPVNFVFFQVFTLLGQQE